MPEYAKMKNAELEALLRERGLPTGGKKADMVDRLTKDDDSKGAAAAAETKPAVNAEDEIDWDDEGDEAAAPPAKADEPVAPTQETTEKAVSQEQQAVPEQTADVAPAKTDDAATEGEAKAAEAKAEEKKEPAPDYSKGLAATNLEEEIERRRKRAEKFGMKVEDDEALKKLERAKKFGEVGPPRGLDEALPERSRKRGREGGDDAGDNKRRGGGGGRHGGRGGRGGGGGGRRDDRRDDRRDNRNKGERGPRKEEGRNGGSGWMSEKDRAAAEARKAKWSKPAA